MLPSKRAGHREGRRDQKTNTKPQATVCMCMCAQYAPTARVAFAWPSCDLPRLLGISPSPVPTSFRKNAGDTASNDLICQDLARSRFWRFQVRKIKQFHLPNNPKYQLTMQTREKKYIAQIVLGCFGHADQISHGEGTRKKLRTLKREVNLRKW